MVFSSTPVDSKVKKSCVSVSLFEVGDLGKERLMRKERHIFVRTKVSIFLRHIKA